MSDIVQTLKFFDNGDQKRERENFQNFLFDRVDQRRTENPISFYRSDFRGARFLFNYFFKNNFSNADFIDCYVESTEFKDCIFKSTEFYNSYLVNVNIQELTFSSTSLVRLVFENTQMSDIKFLSNNIQECKFINTYIADCSFAKTTMDEVTFDKVSFKNVDLSAMTAINLYFSNCRFENVTIDADYLGSYFFKEKYIDLLQLKYRGKLVKLEIDKVELLANLFKLFLEKKRYYEAINIVVQKNFIESNKSSIYPIIRYSALRLIADTNQLVRMYQIEKMFKVLEYYFNTGYIKLYDYYRVIKFFDEVDVSGLSLDDQLVIIGKNQHLKSLVQMSVIEDNMLDGIDPSDLIYLEVVVEDSDEREFEEILEEILRKYTGVDVARNNIYFIIGKRKGSTIYEVLIYLPLGILLINSFTKYLRNNKRNNRISGLRTELASSVLQKMVDKVHEENNPDELRKILEVAQLASNLDPDAFNEDKSTQRLLSLVKAMQGQPAHVSEQTG
ncbi:MAG TPA: pentapeptide repeat-containing protein [Puia sp.]|uniref:pentapeptide repeat-containing protein n=1 Tax=Puia sp. TaxID=2045100 RepID=UPI002B6340CA|nr:pentapeptide repeat-containing protein [Puia sp.]HVU98511.1 pentapeptide repeat-containing protein [Puia sp.]